MNLVAVLFLFVEAFVPLLFFGGIAGVMVLAIMAAVRQQRRAAENLSQLAVKLGLPPPLAPARKTFGLSQPEARGQFRGRPLRVYSYTTGSGKQRSHWCAVCATSPNPKRLTLRISGENMLTRAGRALGIDDVATGEPSFDRQFYVKSNDPAFLRAALLPELQASLKAAWAAGARGTISVDGDEVRYAETGSFANQAVCARMPALAELVCDFGELVEAYPGPGLSG